MCRACFKGSGSEAVRGSPQLQEAVLLSQAMHAGEAVVFAQGPCEWIQCNRVLRDLSLTEFSRANSLVHFLRLAVLWQLEVL